MPRALALFLPALPLLMAAPLQAASGSAAEAQAATAGDWRGELQYRDYQSDRWQGLPVEVRVTAQDDGVTAIRTARYDDGPTTGIVTITTATMIDPAAATASYSIFRKARAADFGTARITAFQPGKDATHWTLVTEERRRDGTVEAQVRETTVREGDAMVTTKDVNPDGDGSDAWLPRNRTVLRRVR